MSDQKINEENKLKIWMQSHERKNSLIQRMIYQIETLENQIENLMIRMEKIGNHDQYKDNR